MLQRLRKALLFLRNYGLAAFIQRLRAEYYLRFSKPTAPAQPDKPQEVRQVLKHRFAAITPIQVFTTPASPSRRLNLVTDSISAGSLFGGVGTAIILSALLAKKWDCELRVITRTQGPTRNNFFQVLNANRIPVPSQVDFTFSYHLDPKSEVPINDGDLFLTTSWWTTSSVIQTMGCNKVLYLLQEDERAFYPFGDDHLRCAEIISNPNLTFIINTPILYEYLVKEGFSNIAKRGLWFQPAWPDWLFYAPQQKINEQKHFFYYARPNNIRNLFYRGLEAIDLAVSKGILATNDWVFHFVGKDIPDISLGKANITRHQNLNWSEYAELVRNMDLGLSLMYTPHPSYPPLDLAASGAVVVTNKFGPKQNLDNYCRNIICSDIDVKSLVENIEKGVEITSNPKIRHENYQNNGIIRDWDISFKDILEKLENWPDVSA